MPLHCLRDALHSFSYTTSRFKTARTVLFHDTRLAAIYSTLVFFVLVYVVLIQVSNRRAASFAISHSNLPQLLFNHAHARFEVPSGYANIWSSGIDSSLQSSLQAPDFCTAGDRSLAWGTDFSAQELLFTGRINVTEYSCIPFDSQLHVTINAGAGGFTATTWERVVPRGANGTSSGETVNRFVDHPELATMNLIHIVTASWMSQGLSNVRTRILNQDGTVFREFKAGEALGGISIAQWLALAGVGSLDEPLVMPFFRGGVKEEQPALRLAGTVLLLRMTYSNYRSWELFADPRCDVTVEQVPTAWGYEGTDLVYDAVLQSPVERTRTGVKLQIIQQGQYGQSRWENVILRLVEALVLFGLARVLTDMVARYCLYGREYVCSVVEEVDLRDDGGSGKGGSQQAQGGSTKVVPGSGETPLLPGSDTTAAQSNEIASVPAQEKAGPPQHEKGGHAVLVVDDSSGSSIASPTPGKRSATAQGNPDAK